MHGVHVTYKGNVSLKEFCPTNTMHYLACFLTKKDLKIMKSFILRVMI